MKRPSPRRGPLDSYRIYPLFRLPRLAPSAKDDPWHTPSPRRCGSCPSARGFGSPPEQEKPLNDLVRKVEHLVEKEDAQRSPDEGNSHHDGEEPVKPRAVSHEYHCSVEAYQDDIDKNAEKRGQNEAHDTGKRVIFLQGRPCGWIYGRP